MEEGRLFIRGIRAGFQTQFGAARCGSSACHAHSNQRVFVLYARLRDTKVRDE
jgi:hypothetical protein